MSTITAQQVKELRDTTGVSVMQCRKALEESDGDLEKAIIILRKKGSEIAGKKADRTASDGIISIKSDGKKALVLILNCETDFVAKNEDFINLANKLLEIAWDESPASAKEKSPALISDIVLKIGENIQLGSIEEISGDTIGAYIHHTGKTATVVILNGGSPEIAKDIAMHAAAMKPKFLSSDEISDEDKNQVMEALKAEVDATDKPQDMKMKIMEGKIASYFKDQTLLDQSFFKSPEKTINQYATENKAQVIKYISYNI